LADAGFDAGFDAGADAGTTRGDVSFELHLKPASAAAAPITTSISIATRFRRGRCAVVEGVDLSPGSDVMVSWYLRQQESQTIILPRPPGGCKRYWAMVRPRHDKRPGHKGHKGHKERREDCYGNVYENGVDLKPLSWS